MANFWEVLLSPTAIHKFLHVITNAYVIGSLFVIGVSAWFLLKNRHVIFAKKSIVIGAVFGLLSSLFLVVTGDGSALDVAQTQPMKLAAMEGLYNGGEGAGLVTVGMLKPGKKVGDPDGEIAPGTAFEDIPDDWVCPVCGVGKGDFVPED